MSRWITRERLLIETSNFQPKKHFNGGEPRREWRL
jgi:hypothetical protein